jgi:hypothetical protein
MTNMRHLISLLLASTVLSMTAIPAQAAEVTPTPAATLSPIQQYELDMIEYKNQFKIYQEARAVREQELRAIATTFIQALKQAHKELKNAPRGASSKANFAAATALAAANRDKAVAELEPLMNPPQPPTKPSGYGMKGNKWKAPSPKAEKKN